MSLFIRLLPCLLLLVAARLEAAPLSISVQAPAPLRADPIVRHAVDDTLQLLATAFPTASISLNRPHATVTLELQAPAKVPADPLAPASRSYRWVSRPQGNRIRLSLRADTPQAVANGLYGLLQEKLGIRFIHPRQTLFPQHTSWPLPQHFSFAGQPRFRHQGFHLHTLHPVELTEQLHDPNVPHAFEDLAAYLDWLARNGQNSFQFFLLRGIDRAAWIPHARRIVEYGHNRGIRCGVELSLAMIQQQAFQAITLLRPIPGYTRQVEETLEWLFQVPWDFVTLESMMGEHLPLISRLLPTAQQHFEQLVQQRYQRPLLYATHVIREKGSAAVRRPLHPASGILIHTVMCYSASEEDAPVYGNRNQRFMLEAAQQERTRRETWYWPESSYWVGFDTPVPLLLLPYLDSRLDDIRVMARLGLQGHLTFTTGWEWGYWLVDWSVARWSWQYRHNQQIVPDQPVAPLADLTPDRLLQQQWHQALALQNRFLKQQGLLRLMAAATPFSELPGILKLPFQPEPEFSYRWLARQATVEERRQIAQGPVTALEQYADAMDKVTATAAERLTLLRQQRRISSEQAMPLEELITALQVGSLRARHRALTLQAIMVQEDKRRAELLLAQAALVRQQAQKLVQQQETRYRYPLGLVARQRPSLTAYPFGYLYPASRLFFWEREEQQARTGRFDPLFMNLWDFRRTLGLESLLLQ